MDRKMDTQTDRWRDMSGMCVARCKLVSVLHVCVIIADFHLLKEMVEVIIPRRPCDLTSH